MVSNTKDKFPLKESVFSRILSYQRNIKKFHTHIYIFTLFLIVSSSFISSFFTLSSFSFLLRSSFMSAALRILAMLRFLEHGNLPSMFSHCFNWCHHFFVDVIVRWIPGNKGVAVLFCVRSNDEIR